MSREWRPGDVAMVTMPSGRKHLALRVGWPADDWISATEGGVYGATSIRPLVVIDPDSNDVERLQDLYLAAEAKGLSGLSMQAALREFANPTPPKPAEPAEPTGLGAVVEDAKGKWWVRLDRQVTPWVDGQSFPQRWRDLDIVRVVSEGVTL